MLDNVKIDRESTTQSALAAKRMRRKEVEILNELMKHSKSGDHIQQLNEEIGRLEGDMLFAEAKAQKRREYANKHIDTIRAQTLSVPPPSTNVFYKSTTRCASEHIPAHIQVRINDILLERTERPSGTVSQLQSTIQKGKLGKLSEGLLSTSDISHSQKNTSEIPLPSIDGRSPLRRGSNCLASNEQLPSKRRQIAKDKLIYNDTPFMLSVGRMRSSSPASIQARLVASGVVKMPQSDMSKLSASLAKRTTLEGDSLSDTDSDADRSERVGQTSEPSPHRHRRIPTLTDINEQPWATRPTHDVLIRDPYMRKYGLHRFNTYLYSEKFKAIIKAANTPHKIVNRDGCDFDYRGNIKGEGMQRGNICIDN